MTTIAPHVRHVLDRLTGVRPSADGWKALCPAHDDQKASLSICVGDDGRVLVHCHAGCESRAVLERVGLSLKDLFAPSGNGTGKHSGRRVVATYDYRDERGELIFQTVRYNPKDFRQRRPNGNGGWIWKIDGVRRVLYRLPELMAADPEAWIFVVEGEKDADNLAMAGLVATTNPCGASKGKSKWRPEYSELLRDRRVAIVPDNDETGHTHAAHVARALHGTARDVRVIKLPGLPDKADVSDWLKDGGTAERLLEMVETAPPSATDDEAQPPHEMENLADAGNARRFAAQHGLDVRYCWPWGKWLVFDRTRWRIDDTGIVASHAKETIRNIYREAADIQNGENRAALVEHATRSERAERINAMIALARSEPGIPILPAQLDTDPWLLNVSNGTLDLRTGELRPHRREDLITKLAPVEYHADAPCQLWLDFLARIMAGNVDLIRFLQRAIGYALTGDVSEQVLFFLHGTGANGKSTLLNVVIDLLGDYAAQLDSHVLMITQGEAHPTALTDLFGRRFVSLIEVEEGKRIAEVLVKQLTGGDRIRARRMREDFWEFRPTHKVFLAANHTAMS